MSSPVDQPTSASVRDERIRVAHRLRDQGVSYRRIAQALGVTQVEECSQMAEANGWVVVGVHQDEGFSAYSGNRGPGLESAKRAAANAAREYGTTAMLVAQAHDRFARGAGDRPGAPQSLGEVWHAARRLDVRRGRRGAT